MPSPNLNFRINQQAFDELMKYQKGNEKPHRVAQRMLTKWLTGSEDINLLPAGRKPINDIEEKN